MEIVKKISQMQNISRNHAKNGKTIAVVPTMGYLHKGHISLIEKARELADIVITTLFVNPTQFGPGEDYEDYPRDLERDQQLADEAGSDYLFYPQTQEMYPKYFSTEVRIKGITEVFEGAFRPGHFNGVALIVSKLFNATIPDIAIFGQKDFQQTLVIHRLVEDLNIPVKIVIAPTIRESNGLAMSSRNTRLSDEEREIAGKIFLALEDGRYAIEKGERRRKMINTIMHKTLRLSQQIRIDYASSALADTLEEPDEFLPGDRVALLIAVFIGKTRLIDNMLVSVPYSLSQKSFIEGL